LEEVREAENGDQCSGAEFAVVECDCVHDVGSNSTGCGNRQPQM
jgi:hypothetical protein